VNQSRECSAIGPGDREQPEETQASADDRSGRPRAPLLLKAGQVAQLLGLGRSTVFALLAAGELPVIRIGRSVRVPRVALEHWIDERTDHVANQGDVRGPLIQDLDDRRPVDDRHS
jgi:excisionase family DNA binding protein